ncbi:MAG TPA: hypothetical protein VE074_03085 [Jatrophihabitantaceae bacterium]|nr:hypothetical protein [Jatrophihabitantaceae bacterium]
MPQPIFLVECYTATATAEAAADLLTRLRILGSRFATGALTPLSCIAVPGDEIFFCLVESDSLESVHRALQRTSIGYERVVGAFAVGLIEPLREASG